MAVIYDNVVKSARMTATRDQFAGGTLEILTSSDVLLATFTLSGTGGTVSGDVWTLAFTANTVTASATGTAAKAQVKTSGGNARLTGLTVGTSGQDVNFADTSFNSGQNVELSSATNTHA